MGTIPWSVKHSPGCGGAFGEACGDHGKGAREAVRMRTHLTCAGWALSPEGVVVPREGGGL